MGFSSTTLLVSAASADSAPSPSASAISALPLSSAADALSPEISSADFSGATSPISSTVVSPAVLGLSATREWAQRLVAEALAVLEPFEERAEPLRQLAQYLLVRRS